MGRNATNAVAGQLVLEKDDPLRYVGIIVEVRGKQRLVRWHSSYEAWYNATELSVDVPEGSQMGDKLGFEEV
jgi:hypothetical protein